MPLTRHRRLSSADGLSPGARPRLNRAPAVNHRQARAARGEIKEETMHAVERPMTKRSGLPIYLAAASLLLAALLLPATASAQWQTCGTNNICNTNSGNVGVGNTNPSNYPLTVQGGAGVGPAGQTYSVFEGIPGTAAAGQTTARRSFNSNKLQLTTWAGSVWNSGLTIDTSGNVGIGATAP